MNEPDTFVLLGSLALASWMCAGLVSAVGYSHSLKPHSNLFDVAALILCGIGAILGAAMLLSLVFSNIAPSM